MRYVCPAAIAAFLMVAASLSSAQNLSITNYQFVSEQRVTRTQSNVTYRADMINRGPAVASVTASLTTAAVGVQAIPGQTTLTFSPVPANALVASNNSFTILVDRSIPFDFASLQWSFQVNAPPPPVAHAGVNQTVRPGSTVTLNGSGSTNVSGAGTLTYNWVFTSRPEGSAAVLQNPGTVMPSFIADVAGTYTLMLTVSNGVASAQATVTVSTVRTPPTSNAGPNQTLAVGSTAVLNGSASTSADAYPLTYSWTLISRPQASTAALSGAATVTPTFPVDKPGIYAAQLIVNDGLPGNAAIVTITTRNSAPVAQAGANQVVNVNSTAQLNGAGSTDADGDPLTYRWSLISVPAGSAAALNNAAAVNPWFTADRPGAYVAQLIVNDGNADSTATTVTITTNQPQSPVALAGSNQTVARNSTVELSGSGTDPQSLPLAYQWALITRPQGSTAVLSSAVIANPVFIADLPGSYVAQLIVNNGYLSSAPATVMISTTSVPPVGNAGANQNVSAGATVKLDGSASSGAYGDPLKYSWSLLARPDGSAATLATPAAAISGFVADQAGAYVAQLIVNDGYTNSNPVTVTIVAQALTLAPGTLNLTNAPGTLTVTLSQPSGAGGQSVALASSNPAVAGVASPVVIPAGSSSADVSVTPGTTSGPAVITASAQGFAGATANVNVANLVLSLPATTTASLGQSSPLLVTLSQAAAAPVTVTLASSDPAKVTVSPASVVIAAGATSPAAQPQVTGAGIGTATVTAASAGLTSGSGIVNVAAPVMSFSAAPLSLVVGNSANLTLTLTGGQAPAGGLSVSLTSSAPGVAGVPATVNFAAGANSVPVMVSGVSAGNATITASYPGMANATATVNVTQPSILLSARTLQLGDAANLQVTLSAPALAPVTIVLASSDPSKVSTSPASVMIAQGATAPASAPQLTGVGIGPATITATAAGYTSGTKTVTVPAPVMSFSPTSVSIDAGSTANLTLNLTGGKGPASWLLVTLSSSTASAKVPASVYFAPGMQSVSVPVTGMAPGAAAITASAMNVGTVSADVYVFVRSIGVPAASVGQNLQTAITLALSPPAPPAGVVVTLTTSDPSKLLLAGRPGDAGAQQIRVGVPQGLSSVGGIYLQALAGAGSVTITATAADYPDSQAAVSLTPSGFLIAAADGTSSFTTNAGAAKTDLKVSAARLDATLNFAEVQQLRSGYSVAVALASSNPAVGTVASPVAFSSGMDTALAAFTPASLAGSTTVSVAAPAGFSVPVAGASVTAVVNQAGLSCAAVTVGRNLAAAAACSLQGGVPVAGLPVTLTSSDPAKVLLSKTANAAGAASITVSTVGTPGGGVVLPGFYVYGVTDSGESGFTAQAPGFGMTPAVVTLTPSALAISGPGGIGASSFVAFNATTSIAITPVRLNASLQYAEAQALAGGITAVVNVANSNPAVGTIPAGPVTLTGGSTGVFLQFQRGGAGASDLSLDTPAGFTAAPALAKLTANVLAQGFSLSCDGGTVGQNLQMACSVTVGQPAPFGGLAVSLTSNDPAKMLLSATAAGDGASAITVTIPAGNTTGVYYAQALGNAGVVTQTAAVAGFTSRDASMTLAPSGVVITGPVGLFLFASISSGTLPVDVYTAVLTPDHSFMDFQPLRGGAGQLLVTLASSAPAAGTITPVVAIDGGSGHATAAFTPVSSGSTTIAAQLPEGWTGANNRTSMTVFVTP